MSYAGRWTRVWCILAAVGVGFATVRWSSLVVVLAVMVSAAVARVVLAIHENIRAPAVTGPASHRGPQAGQRALMAGCCVVAMYTLLDASPALAMLALVLAVVTSPVVVRRRPRATAATPTETTGTTEPSVDPGERLEWPEADRRSLELLGDGDLFKLWRRTFWELDSQPTVQQLACLVALRQSCLDELGRRNPVALRTWLSSGARASGGPERFWPQGTDSGDDPST